MRRQAGRNQVRGDPLDRAVPKPGPVHQGPERWEEVPQGQALPMPVLVRRPDPRPARRPAAGNHREQALHPLEPEQAEVARIHRGPMVAPQEERAARTQPAPEGLQRAVAGNHQEQALHLLGAEQEEAASRQTAEAMPAGACGRMTAMRPALPMRQGRVGRRPVPH